MFIYYKNFVCMSITWGCFGAKLDSKRADFREDYQVPGLGCF